MPALSKKQQKFMGIVRSIQKGEQPASKFNKDAQDVAKDMKKTDVKKFASTKHKGLPMKKEVLNKLKEMIKQELSEYTYGTGDVVKDVNPSCPHYGAMGKVKSVNPRSVVFVVMNKGKNFKPGMELEKSHDQMKKMNENKVYKVGDTISLLSFDRRNRGKAKVKSVAKSKPNKFGIKNHYVTDKGTFSDMEVVGTDAYKLRFKGNTEKQVMKAMQSPGSAITRESVNEMSDKTKKIINKLGKKEKEMFIDMVDMLGFDQVMADYKRDKKAFKQALKDMSESVIQERNDEIQTGKEYTKLWLQSINLIIKQANSLKGQLAKHPIKRDLNKLKAVENLFKKFIKPAVEREGKDNRHYAPNQTELKKYLSDSKFKIAIRILKQTLKPANGYDENSFYYLGDKEKKLLEKMSKVLYGIETKLDNTNLENVNESMSPSQLKKMRDDFEKTGELPPHLKKFVKDVNVLKKKHKVKNIVVPGLEWMSDMKESVNEASVSQVRSTISRVKKQLMKKWDKKGGYENFGQKELRNLKSKFKENPYGSPEERQISQMLSAFNNWAMNYSGDMRESVNEDGHTDVASSKRKVMIMVDDSNKLLNKLNGMNKEDSLPSWWTDKITLSQKYLEKATNYLLNPVESVNEDVYAIVDKFNQKKQDYDQVYFKDNNLNIVKKHMKKMGKKYGKMNLIRVKTNGKMSLVEAMSKSQASELLKQLGGNKFISMTGAKNLSFSGLGLTMQIGKNSKGVTHVRFQLSSKDLYDITFYSIRGSNVKTKSKEKGVYVDQLGKIFKKNTGLNVRL